MYGFKSDSPKLLKRYSLPGRPLILRAGKRRPGLFCVPKADENLPRFANFSSRQIDVADADARTRIEGFKPFASATIVRIIRDGTLTKLRFYIRPRTEGEKGMPIYEYSCKKCGAHMEVMQKVSDKPLTRHARCGGKLEKEWSRTGFQFKGSGWYVTDYAGKKTDAKEGKESKETKGDSSAKADAAAKADAPAKAAGAETKPAGASTPGGD